MVLNLFSLRAVTIGNILDSLKSTVTVLPYTTFIIKIDCLTIEFHLLDLKKTRINNADTNKNIFAKPITDIL